jgi:hypothetical protein
MSRWYRNIGGKSTKPLFRVCGPASPDEVEELPAPRETTNHHKWKSFHPLWIHHTDQPEQSRADYLHERTNTAPSGNVASNSPSLSKPHC